MATKTMQAFVRRYKITAIAKRVDENPNMADMPQGSSHWSMTLCYGRRRLTVPFSQGPAHTKEPTAEDVLGCLLSDASSVEYSTEFADWAADMGCDADSRKAERTYRLIQQQTAKVQRFLGDAYDAAKGACAETETVM